MIEARILRHLLISGPSSAARTHLSAASGLLRLADHVFVVADDENDLVRFDLSSAESGRAYALFAGELPRSHKARKALKPDCEALLLLPAFGEYVHGAVMAIGSGSRPSRYRAALVALDSAGEIRHSARTVDMSALLHPLSALFADLNIEGAFVQGDSLCLLQRGNGGSAINARIDLNWPETQRWLCEGGPVPVPSKVWRFELGAIAGVPLSFTDGAALPGGEWVFSAAAEDTRDTYADGPCVGSAVGIVDANGAIRAWEPLSPGCKVEGIAATAVGQAIDLLMVTDADDREQPAMLLAATVHP